MELDAYLAYHQRRFDYICGLAQRLKPSRASLVLDVGPGPMTKQLNTYYDVVWSLGFEHTAVYSAAEGGRRHITFDLNRANDPAAWVPMPKFDLIVFSEVIEHVQVRHEDVLTFLGRSLTPDGLILCTTPNVAAFHKRLRGVAGLTPWHRWESGHVTEFSKADLVEIGRRAGLQTRFHAFANYFGFAGSPLRRDIVKVIDSVTGLVPTLRRGQVIVYAH
jgi:trans-aconitate methyltransferase